MSRSSATKQRSRASRTQARTPVGDGKLPVSIDLLTAGAPLDADLEMERQRRLEALQAELKRLFAAGRGDEAIGQVLALIQQLERDNEQLAWRVLRATRYRFGRNTERLSREELNQLALAFGGDAVPTSAGAEPAVPAPPEPEQCADPPTPETSDLPAAAASDPPKPKRRQRVRAMTVGPDVERNVTVTPVPEAERKCSHCGSAMDTFGYVDHERIRYVPARIVVDIERCEKVGCRHCREDVAVAPREQAPAIVRKVDASLLAKLLAEKTVLGLPVDRQRRELGRLGLEVPDKTLQSYWAYTTDLLEPVAACNLSLAFGQPIVGADDSHLKTLDKSSKHGAFRGHLWCFIGTDGTVGGPEIVAYGYTPSWDAAEITDWFSAIDGFIQCDGYAGYSREVDVDDGDDGETIVAVPSDRRLGCGMHVRSKFHAALLAKDRRAAVPLKLFADLYQIEADCKARSLDAAARGEERRRRSLPLLAALDGWVDDLHPKLLPKSPLRRATTYAINQRESFRRCFDDGRFEIDNGRVERRIRMFAVARRNFLFTGSPRGGERLAVAFTLTDNCLALGVDPERYLVDVINKIEGGWPLRRLSELIPLNWAADQAREHRRE
jgi:transposase